MLRFSKVRFAATQDFIKVDGTGTRSLASDKFVLTHVEGGVLVQRKEARDGDGPWWFADSRFDGTVVDPESIKVK